MDATASSSALDAQPAETRDIAMKDETALGERYATCRDVVAAFDDEGTLLYLNPAGRRLLGYGSAEDLGGSHLSDYYPDPVYESFVLEAYAHAARNESWRGTAEMLTRDGRALPTRQRFEIQRTGDGRFLTLTVTARHYAP